MAIKSRLGSFLTTKMAAKSVRQRHVTGPQYYRRRFFRTARGHHQLHRRVSGFAAGPPMQVPEHQHFAHHGGDVQKKPESDYSFDERQDKLRYSWKKEGELQVHQIGGKPETFVCFRCGYPTRSNLQVIKSDNWDWRMCYPCYKQVRRDGMEKDV